MTKKTKNPTVSKLKKEYFQNLEELDDMVEMDSTTLNVRVTKGRSCFEFSLDIESDNHCCGLFSVGTFRVISDSKFIPENEKISLIKNTFERLVSIAKNKPKSEYTLFFTLIKSPVCNLVKEAVKDEKYFTAVKTFINANSGIQNTLYVSN